MGLIKVEATRSVKIQTTDLRMEVTDLIRELVTPPIMVPAEVTAKLMLEVTATLMLEVTATLMLGVTAMPLLEVTAMQLLEVTAMPLLEVTATLMLEITAMPLLEIMGQSTDMAMEVTMVLQIPDTRRLLLCLGLTQVSTAQHSVHAPFSSSDPDLGTVDEHTNMHIQDTIRTCSVTVTCLVCSTCNVSTTILSTSSGTECIGHIFQHLSVKVTELQK
ncbi:hypothetical protein BsWGS_26150 [Bradybaena similaris]